MVFLDIVFLLSIFMGLWIGFGFLGDIWLNKILLTDLPCFKTSNTTSHESWGIFFKFVVQDVWHGRVWFYGFVLFFVVLGMIGCIFFFCCRDKGNSSLGNNRDYYDRSFCYWWWCGPTYYNGYYYSNPYGYYNSSDVLCCWICCLDTPTHTHHHGGTNCDCGGGTCSGCDSCGNGSDDCCSGDGDGKEIMLIILLIVVIIMIICGIVFTVFISFMIGNKIIKRHTHILQKQGEAIVQRVRDRDANVVPGGGGEQSTLIVNE